MDVAKRNKFLGFVILVLFMALSVTITYKAQMGSGFHKEIKDTWRWAHKEAVEYAIELSGANGHLEQSFLCPVPELSCVNVRIRTKDIKSNDAVVNISLIDNSTGETIGYKRNELLGISDEEDFSDVKVPLDSGIDSKDHVYTLSLDVENLGEGCLYINSNFKQGLVTSFNGNEADKTNIISQIKFGNTGVLLPYFLTWGVLLMLFMAVAFYLLVVLGADISKAFLPIAVFYGILMLLLVPVNGVPDESWHMDTAYKYSNYMMLLGGTGEPDTIYKRQCDVSFTDMLPNDIETGSYYQMINRPFDRPVDTELVKVTYFDSSKQVLFLNFVPSALGLSIGRILGLSPVITYQLARFLSLIAYVLLVWMAVRIIPVWKELMAMISLLPIMIQQAASFSYDGVLMGIVFLFISICVYLMKEDNAGTKWYVLCALAALYLLLNKGAVYLPIALIMFLIKKPQTLQKITLSRNKKIAILLVVVAVAAIVAVTRFMPILSNIALAGEASQGPDDKLSLGYLIGHPLLVVRLFWNTIFDSSDKLFLGVLGGVLGWHNKVVVAFLPVLNLLGLILLSNASDDEKITGKLRGLFLAAGVLSMGMISLAMMLAETTYSSKFILGLQGRYFAPQMLLIIIALVGGVFKLDKKHVPGIMTMMLGVDAFIMLQVFAGVL